jgi:sugar lactone lactonase YvrE
MPRRASPFLLLCCLLLAGSAAAQTQATTVPLILPGGLAYDTVGNLYFAETGNHIVRRVTPAGIITTVAGTGVQGFAGDGGAATLALLDSPSSVALDAAGDLFLADAHNHRIRRVDAVTSIITTFAGTGIAAELDLPSALAFDAAQNLYFADQRRHVVRRIDHASGAITTVAGNGTQAYSGDLGPATQAAIDSPSGLALDASGNLYIADTHNHRIRRVDAVTGVITSVAGTGQPGFAGDASAATSAAIDLPRGLALDAGGNLFLVDSRNQRIRRIDATTGQIATIAGDGTQAFAGDQGFATAASLDTPRAIAISPANLPALADSANDRVRQVDTAADIHTIAGLGTTAADSLLLTGPAATQYGTGTLTATLKTSPATGSIAFYDATKALGTEPLSANVASMATSSLAAGAHTLSAAYPGDTLHAAAQSNAMSMTISPAPLLAAPISVSSVYGLAVPALAGSLSGVLPQDSGLVTLTLSSSANALSTPGTYAIAASLSGASAANYALTQTAASVTIAKAASAITLSNALSVHVASSTAGVPTGSVALYDGGALYATATLSPTGDASFSSTALSLGTHTLTASYSGDADFLSATSAPIVATIGTGASADFALASSGPSSVTVAAGNPAVFAFTANPVNGTLSSPIQLTVSGLPSGATASFTPTYLPPSSTAAPFTLTIQTPKSASLDRRSLLVFALLLPVVLLARKRRLLLAVLVFAVGCGDRVNTSAVSTASASYNIVVTGTATSTAGATLQHTATMILTIQ